MAPPRFLGALSIRILLLGSVLLAALAYFGLPVSLQLDPTRIRFEPENAYVTTLPKLPWPLIVTEDGPGKPRYSKTELLENGRLLGPPHTGHASIRRIGGGRYSHWQRALRFSTSDNSDPRANGRRYVAVVRVQLAPQILQVAFMAWVVAGLAVLARRLVQGSIGPWSLLLPVVLWAGVVLLFGFAVRTESAVFGLFLGAAAVVAVWAVAMTRLAFVQGSDAPWKSYRVAQNATLLLVSLSIAVTATEALLKSWEGDAIAGSRRQSETDVSERETPPIELALESFGVQVPRDLLHSVARRAALITMPPEFERQPVEIEGARAVRWHGVLHVKDRNAMRRTIPFPARQEHVFRTMVVGDSLTYGDGIEERWTYSRQLEALLEPDYNVEVLNLGIDGHQSEDVLVTVREFLPRLSPDLVIYGAHFNDFLPSGMGQFKDRYAFPLPDSVKSFFTERSRLARLIEDAYTSTLLRLGLRLDSFDYILKDFTGYQQRFARDVAQMNELVRAAGLPPIVALVLDQRPSIGSRGYQIAQVAEKYFKSAQMDVVEMAPYYRQFDAVEFRVSPWEGHPNEIANAIWAVMLNRHLQGLPELQAFRKSEG